MFLSSPSRLGLDQADEARETKEVARGEVEGNAVEPINLYLSYLVFPNSR